MINPKSDRFLFSFFHIISMPKDIKENRMLLKSIDKQYENDPTVPERVEEFRKKYSRLTFEDLYRPFTI